MNKSLLDMTALEKNEFWLANLRTARKMWSEIPPEQADLRAWRRDLDDDALAPQNYDERPPSCGTIACFGGWIALRPEFKELGVCPTCGGAPMMDNLAGCRGLLGDQVAKYLFGDAMLFSTRLPWRAACTTPTMKS